MPVPPNYKPQPGDPRYGRSAITNGSALLPGVDGRSPWVRRAKDLIQAHLADLGGEDNTNAAVRSLVRRAAVLAVELEQLELKFALAGGAQPSDLDLYVRASGGLRRLFEGIGLRRVARDITPSLSDIEQEHAESATP
jgi:hypothetical protein